MEYLEAVAEARVYQRAPESGLVRVAMRGFDPEVYETEHRRSYH